MLDVNVAMWLSWVAKCVISKQSRGLDLYQGNLLKFTKIRIQFFDQIH